MATVARYPEDDVRQFGALQQALPGWLEELEREKLADERYREVFAAIDTALRETIAYIRQRRENGVEDIDHEYQLSGLWMAAASQASRLSEPRLAQTLRLKGMGWTDPQWWEQAEQQGFHIKVEDVEALRTELDTKRAEATQAAVAARSGRMPLWFPVAGVVFTALTIVFLMYYVLSDVAVDQSKRTAFNLLMAFCAAGSFGFIGGTLVARGSIPGLKGTSPIAFTATGGIGVLIVVFALLQYLA